MVSNKHKNQSFIQSGLYIYVLHLRIEQAVREPLEIGIFNFEMMRICGDCRMRMRMLMLSSVLLVLLVVMRMMMEMMMRLLLLLLLWMAGVYLNTESTNQMPMPNVWWLRFELCVSQTRPGFLCVCV